MATRNFRLGLSGFRVELASLVHGRATKRVAHGPSLTPSCLEIWLEGHQYSSWVGLDGFSWVFMSWVFHDPYGIPVLHTEGEASGDFLATRGVQTTCDICYMCKRWGRGLTWLSPKIVREEWKDFFLLLARLPWTPAAGADSDKHQHFGKLIPTEPSPCTVWGPPIPNFHMSYIKVSDGKVCLGLKIE